MTLYKLTTEDGAPLHGGGGKWDLPRNGKPGKWRKVEGILEPCIQGLHLLRASDLRSWATIGRLWIAESGKERIIENDKIVCRRARLVAPAADITRTILVEWACECAARLIQHYTLKHLTDNRPQAAIEAARACLASIGTDDEKKTRNAANAAARAAAYAADDAAANAAAYAASNAAAYTAAAYAAAYTADAAAYAAYAAANAANAAAYAASNAANAAAYTADDAASNAAAYTAETKWQFERLCELLGIPYEEAAT